MDQRTLVVSCVEYYSDLKAIPSDKVFSAFVLLSLSAHSVILLSNFPPLASKNIV